MTTLSKELKWQRDHAEHESDRSKPSARTDQTVADAAMGEGGFDRYSAEASRYGMTRDRALEQWLKLSPKIRAAWSGRRGADDNAVLSYGSDNAGGVHLCLGDARVHLSADAVRDLAAGLMAEATRPASPAPKEPAR